MSAILYMLAYTVSSVMNDNLVRFTALHVDYRLIVFMRFSIGCLTLLAILLYHRRRLITSKFWTHCLSGCVLALAMKLYTRSLSLLPISTNIAGVFAIPVITSLLSRIILREKNSMRYSFISFLGVLIAVYNPILQLSAFMYLAVAVLLFSALDIINKLLLNRSESKMIIMFYVNLYAALFSYFGVSSMYIAGSQWLWLILIAINSQLVFYFLLQSFARASLSVVQPIKYVELPLAFLADYLIWDYPISYRMVLGTCIIFVSGYWNLRTQKQLD